MEVCEQGMYDPAVLKRLQKVEVEILNDLTAICKKYDIPYFLLGGSCIGVFRHKGFVPWDDDIDVCMLRKDYERFCEVAPKEIEGKYDLVDPRQNPHLPYMFSKFSKRGTACQNSEFIASGLELGINVDIFPFDPTSSDPELRKKQARKAWLYAKLKMIYFLKNPHLPVGGWKGKVLAVACRVLHACMQLFPSLPLTLTKKYLNVCHWFDQSPTDFIVDLSYIRPAEATMRYDQVFPTVTMPFEDTEVEVPNQADVILRQYYGDYMQLPPEDKRKNHCPEVLDFGDGE